MLKRASSCRPCSACTYENSIQFDTCKICQTSRCGGSSSSSAAAISTPSYVNGNSNITMTPTILKQKWKSYGSQAVSSITTFPICGTLLYSPSLFGAKPKPSAPIITPE